MPPVRRPALRERSLELEAIDAALAAARDGDGGLLAVEGAAGIGKTSLIGAARECAAAAGVTVLGARGSELERDFAWGVVRQLVEPALYRAGARERRRWFAGAAALARPRSRRKPSKPPAAASPSPRSRPWPTRRSPSLCGCARTTACGRGRRGCSWR
jgi:AAA ATPase-like protein